MKKAIAVLLCMMMTLGACCAMAEEQKAMVELTDQLNIAMTIPQNYEMFKEQMDTALYAEVIPLEEGLAYYTLSIAFSDMNTQFESDDLSDENTQKALNAVAGDFNKPEFSVTETGFGTKLLVIDETEAESDYAFMITNYEGYFIQMYLEAPNGRQLTEEEFKTALDMMTSLELITE